MKRVLKWLGIVVGVLLLAGGVFYAWAATTTGTMMEQTYSIDDVDIPVPFPLTAEELAALPEGSDPDTIALQRALERGEHLIAARYGCRECHGSNFGGGVMVDDPALEGCGSGELDEVRPAHLGATEAARRSARSAMPPRGWQDRGSDLRFWPVGQGARMVYIPDEDGVWNDCGAVNLRRVRVEVGNRGRD